MSGAWSSQSERGTVFWLHVIYWIARRIGRPIAMLFLYPITGYFFLTAKSSRQASAKYLTRVLGREPKLSEVFRHHYVFSVTILDRVYLLTDYRGSLDISLHSQQPLLDELKSGKGCLLLGSHLGSFEALRALGVSLPQAQLKVLMQEQHNQNITNFLHRLNPEVAKTVIPLGRPDTMLRVKESLEGGGIVGILGDRIIDDDKKVYCEFLGARACFPVSPAMIAFVLNVPVFIFFGLYTGTNRYQIHFEKLSDGQNVAREDRTQAVQELMCRFAGRLEYWAKKEPCNWFNFYDYWQEQ